MKEGSVWTPLYSIFINVDSGHLCSRGSYSTTSPHTDISAACASPPERITLPPTPKALYTQWYFLFRKDPRWTGRIFLLL